MANPKRLVESVAEAMQQPSVITVTGFAHDAETAAINWIKDRCNTYDIIFGLVVTEGTKRVYRAELVDAYDPVLWVVLIEPEIISYPVIGIEGGKYYRVTYEGTYGTMAPDGYHGYRERLIMRDNGTLPPGEQVYDYAQALDHIRQLKRSGTWPPERTFYVLVTVETTIKIPVK